MSKNNVTSDKADRPGKANKRAASRAMVTTSQFSGEDAFCKKRSFRAPYEARGYRMFTPFLTQLSRQYDSVEIANTERMERRRLAQQTYTQKLDHKSETLPPINENSGIKV